MAKLLDLSVYGPGHISNILQVDASVYAKAFITDSGNDTHVVRGDGTLASISSLSVSNADKLDGYHATYANNKPWGTIPVIATGGYMDVGKQFEFHYDNTTGRDYSTALVCTGNYSNVVNLPSSSGTLALTSQIPISLPANGGNADTVDNKHATDFLGWSSRQNIGTDSPFQDAVNFFNNLSNLNNGGKMLYNSSGKEYTILFTRRNDSTAHGTILKWGCLDKYIRIIRMISGEAQSTDWEKISAGYADSAGNADTVDNQHFSYSNDSNSPTYLWATNSNGSSFLAARSSLSVNYANSTGTATTLYTNNTAQDASLCYNESPGLHFYRFNGTGNDIGGGDGFILQWSWNPGSVGGQIYLDDNPSKIAAIRGYDIKSKTFTSWSKFIHSSNYTDYVNTTNFPGLNKVGTVTSVTVTGANGLSGSGTITSSGTITLSNSGVRSVSINGNYLRVNTNGTNADLTIPYATSAGSVAWGNVTGKPSSYAPSSHNHSFTLGATTITTGGTCTAITGPFGVLTDATADKAFSIYRSSALECVKHWVDDNTYYITYTNDEAASLISIRLINTDTERATNKGADAKDVTVYLDCYRDFYPNVNNTGSIGTSSYKWAHMYATTFHGSLDGNANSASSVAWANVTGKPSTFTPASHNHDTVYAKKDGTGASGTWGINITGSAGSVAWGNVTGKPSSYTPASHNHDTLYPKKDGTGASGSWDISITGSAGSVAWGNVTGKPSKFTPSSHTHYATTYKDSRNEAMTPSKGAAVNGIAIDFKTKANGVGAGSGNYCGLVTFDPYSDESGGYPLQIGFNTGTDTNNTNDVYIRTAKDASTWNSWRTIINNVNYTSYTVKKDGTGASGTWGISITGNAATATKLQTVRTLTIGNTGKSFNGSSNVSWTLSEIGAAASSHTHTKSQITDFPSSLPASDVYAWAKASSKPSYSFSEITPGVATIGDGGANRLMFRTNASYRSGIYYSTSGNESMVFANINSVTGWIFATIDPTTNKDWTTLTPSLQIKNSRVTINKLIANGTNASYNLDVNGSANATTLYENGVRVSVSGHSHSYLPLSGGTCTGNIYAPAFYESSDERLKDFYNTVDVNLDKLSSLPKKFFKWKSNPNGEFEIGTSAQELQKIYPQLVNTDDKGYLTVAYDKLSIIALRAIDKLYEMNKNLERRVQVLESKI